jgi:hypothetical protein
VGEGRLRVVVERFAGGDEPQRDLFGHPPGQPAQLLPDLAVETSRVELLGQRRPLGFALSWTFVAGLTFAGEPLVAVRAGASLGEPIAATAGRPIGVATAFAGPIACAAVPVRVGAPAVSVRVGAPPVAVARATPVAAEGPPGAVTEPAVGAATLVVGRANLAGAVAVPPAAIPLVRTTPIPPGLPAGPVPVRARPPALLSRALAGARATVAAVRVACPTVVPPPAVPVAVAVARSVPVGGPATVPVTESRPVAIAVGPSAVGGPAPVPVAVAIAVPGSVAVGGPATVAVTESRPVAIAVAEAGPATVPVAETGPVAIAGACSAAIGGPATVTVPVAGSWPAPVVGSISATAALVPAAVARVAPPVRGLRPAARGLRTAARGLRTAARGLRSAVAVTKAPLTPHAAAGCATAAGAGEARCAFVPARRLAASPSAIGSAALAAAAALVLGRAVPVVA